MKEIKKIIKAKLVAGKAIVAPPIGPLLSQNNINPSLFVKAFNEKTINDNVTYSVKIFIFTDKTFDFELAKTTSNLILDKLKLKGGSNKSANIILEMSNEDFEFIIKEKSKDFPNISLESIRQMIKGTARNMGISIQQRGFNFIKFY